MLRVNNITVQIRMFRLLSHSKAVNDIDILWTYSQEEQSFLSLQRKALHYLCLSIRLSFQFNQYSVTCQVKAEIPNLVHPPFPHPSLHSPTLHSPTLQTTPHSTNPQTQTTMAPQTPNNNNSNNPSQNASPSLPNIPSETPTRPTPYPPSAQPRNTFMPLRQPSPPPPATSDHEPINPPGT